AQKLNYGAPWIHSDPAADFLGSIDEMIGSWEAIPPGVLPREGSSHRYPPQIPDLIGLKDRRYLDHTGLVGFRRRALRNGDRPPAIRKNYGLGHARRCAQRGTRMGTRSNEGSAAAAKLFAEKSGQSTACPRRR